MLDVISVGDVTEDVFVQANELFVRCEHKNGRKACYLCMRYSDKIAAQRVDKLIGGNAGNFAIGSRRLGLKSALFAEVGNDIQGKRILQSLKDEKVSTKYFTLTKGGKTNYSVVLNHKGERTILVHHELRKYTPKKLEKCGILYVTSMGKGSERLFPSLLSHIKKTNAKMGFNPGTHQLKLGKKKLKKMIQASYVVSLNTEETQLLLNDYTRDFRKYVRDYMT